MRITQFQPTQLVCRFLCMSCTTRLENQTPGLLFVRACLVGLFTSSVCSTRLCSQNALTFCSCCSPSTRTTNSTLGLKRRTLRPRYILNNRIVRDYVRIKFDAPVTDNTFFLRVISILTLSITDLK